MLTCFEKVPCRQLSSRAMCCLKVCVVLFLVLQNHASYSFDEFIQGEALYSSTKETLSTTLFHGISENCNRTLRSLDNNARWKYFDSWGKPGSGILSGNVKWFGAFDQCIRIPGAKYCVVNVLGKFRTNMTFPIWYGICVPEACDLADTVTMVQNFVHNVSHRFFPSIRVVDISCYEEQSFTTSVVFTIIFCCVILACCVVGTAIDIRQESLQDDKKRDILTKQNGVMKDQVESSLMREVPKIIVTETTPLIRANKKENGYVDNLKLMTEQENKSKPAEDDTVSNNQQLKPNSFLVEFFLCFSVLRNSRDVMKTDVPPGAVTSLYGVRVISMFWIILAHIYVFARARGTVENLTELYAATEHFSMVVVTNAYPAVDSFFFLSGLLLMYNVMKRLKRNDGELHWGKFCLHRYLRLTPVLMFVILFGVQLEPFVDKGPLWQKHLDRQNCDEYWWTNLLYINNFYPTNVAADSCMVWTWYLAVDMQLFLVSPVVIYLFYRYGYRGVIGTSVILGSASVICIAILTKHYDIHPMALSMYKASPSSGLDEFNYLHVKPYCRVHAYLIGLVMGYLMQTSAFRAKQLEWRSVVIFWFLAAALALTLIYAPFTALREDPRIWTMSEKILFSTTRHLVWGLVLAWVIYACEYGCGGYIHEFLSARFWIPLGRLTYSTYLVHCQLIIVMYYGYRSGLLYSAQWWAYIYCAAVSMSYGIAFILVVTVEYPCANLEKLLFKRLGRKDPK